MLLSIKELKVSYGKAQVVKGVSLDVEDRSIATLIGANGAGKTTILRAISGITHITSGEIWFRGERVDNLSPQKIVREGISMVPEGRRLFPSLSVLENLSMGAYLRKDSLGIKNDLEETYKHFPVLKERLSQVAGSLSGGQQQMLAIARTLMANPKLILLDEPSLGLSPLLVQEIWHVIGNLNKRGVGIVLVEQNAIMALQLAQKGYILASGELILAGDTKDLMNDERVIKAYLGT